jgi:hypothetical protein
VGLVTIAAMIPAVLLATAALSGAPGAAGVGIGASDVCLSTPARPGGSYQPGTVYVVNTGSATETITLDTGPMLSWQVETVTTVDGTQRDVVQTVPHPEDDFTRHALPVPAAWVTFGYPALLWVIPRHSVTIDPGQHASIPVTLHIQASARHGQCEAALTARTADAPAPAPGASPVTIPAPPASSPAAASPVSTTRSGARVAAVIAVLAAAAWPRWHAAGTCAADGHETAPGVASGHLDRRGPALVGPGPPTCPGRAPAPGVPAPAPANPDPSRGVPPCPAP